MQAQGNTPAQEEVTEWPPRDPNKGFDDRVHIKNAKTGEMIRKQPYRSKHLKDGEGSKEYCERPVGSGNLFTRDGAPAGRIDGDWAKWEKVDHKAAHKAFVEKTTSFAKVGDIIAENEQLRAELAAMTAEKDAKLKTPEQPKK